MNPGNIHRKHCFILNYNNDDDDNDDADDDKWILLTEYLVSNK